MTTALIEKPTMSAPPAVADPGLAEAQAWVASQLRFEHLLHALEQGTPPGEALRAQ
jgi:hypothetical protein